MAFLIRIIKARHLKNKFTHYVGEKELAIVNQDNPDFETPEKTSKFKNWFLGRFINKLSTPNAIENLVWKSFLGFVGGVILTYIFFIFFHIGVNFSLKSTTYVCGVSGIILCLGLAFSSKVRCYVLLLLPVFFSKQGRQALLAYALFLAFTGPTRNTMHNMGILSDSMNCGQEMVRRTLKQIIEMVKAPFRSIKETMQKIAASVKEVIESVKNFVMKIKRIIVSILKVIKKATTWLGSIINFCNKKIGTPFQRCMKTFDDAITDCKAKMGVMDFLCHVVHVVKALCYTVKWLDFICMFTEFVSDKIVGVVKKKLREFSLHMKNLFYVSIEFSHNYEFETTASNSTKEVSKTILMKFGKKIEKLQKIFNFFGFMFTFLFLFVFFKVYYYKYKYMSSDRFDNMYISKYIVELDMKRAKMDRETVLPLEPREKRKYAKPTALRLLNEEKSRIAGAMFFLSLTTFKVITFLVLDYSLYWVLISIYEAGKDAFDETESSKFGIHVQGKGILANFYKSLGKNFEVPENPNMQLNPLHCLPDPVEPDTGRYLQIGFLVGLCWILTLLEPYGLRLRNIVMSHYYPDRARERAVWLYNHILRTRGSFIRFARRQLRRKFQGGEGGPVEKVTLTQRLFASFPLLGAIFGKNKENACLLCGAPETKTQPLKRCKTPDCPGRYCLTCYGTLQNICTICQHPIEYGDVSDISEEVDSSEEDLYRKKTGNSLETTSDYSSGDDKNFMTFKDMELRDGFKDVEANKIPDYAKLGDLYSDKAALKKRVKEVLLKRLQNLEAEKERISKKRQNEIKEVKSKVKNLISKLRKKKSEQVTTRKSVLKKKSMENLGETNDGDGSSSGQTKHSKSRVSFNLAEEEDPDQSSNSQHEYRKLRNDIKAKIMNLRERQDLEKNKDLAHTKPDYYETATGENSSSWPTKTGSEPSEDSFDRAKPFTYYFIEKERDFDFYVPEPPDFDGSSI